MSIRNFYKMQPEKKMHLRLKQSRQQQQPHHESNKHTTTKKRTRTLQILHYGVDSSFEDGYELDNAVYEVRGFFTGILFLLLVREVVRRCFNDSNRD
mmetsp:Transcript_29378/g.41313  ORF Transcript_29378/g.41313 Transcript_29378/m.41313 type:complete len:97 (+) Transcript_29378:310-600(+)